MTNKERKERKRDIYKRYLGGKRQIELAKEEGVSKQRIFQIIKECKIEDKLKELGAE